MRYDVYLAAGYLLLGVIEGACRHFIKDRMERSGMRWTIESAQAMLDMRQHLSMGIGTTSTVSLEKETRLYRIVSLSNRATR